jgi:nitronate monooxygenase
MIGTRFMLAEEAGTSASQRETIGGLSDTDTFVSDAVTGRAARWVANRLSRTMLDGPPPLGWGPEQRAELTDIARAAMQADRGDLVPTLAGQAAGLDPRILPAAAIVETIAARARDVLRGLSPE